MTGHGRAGGHVVIASDKFKGSLTAAEVAEHVAAGLGPRVRTVAVPVADGGDGTVDAVVSRGLTRVRVEVPGPTGEPVTAAYAWRPAAPDGDGPVAVIELAEASGLRRLPAGPAPLTASSHGTGVLIGHALRRGARRIVLGLGGSACTDGGAGMLQALGVRLLDEAGRDLPPGGAALRRLARIDVSGLRAGAEVVVASDVDNPLLGPHGAAAVYGPQKGASPADVAVLEEGLSRFARVAARTVGEGDGVPYAERPGAGAAGGVGFAAMAFLGARIEPGIRYLLGVLGFDALLDGARLVITGEGSLDEQTLRGKAPAGVAEAAGRRGVPVIAVCGRRTLDDDRLRAAGIRAAYALTDLEPDPDVCIAHAGPLLERLAARIAATEPELRT
ncbi:glycerate kinase [Thermopolyspora flexuosa]|uniref:Glycerate kinase n=1 Tax=Thermopolyspora flexuosa TaxID=103836 RepID=A0A543IZU4_9ACTN|nr:glycerate kinase [Thermopolyspora flexuosa]TQM76093.1 glycerate kinase [Thermopolyspora flexuosa]GGM64644.1 glycerate kinase [Thermopolyspora flexuosa]